MVSKIILITFGVLVFLLVVGIAFFVFASVNDINYFNYDSGEEKTDNPNVTIKDKQYMKRFLGDALYSIAED